jgi:hypothetical protein
MEQELFEHVRTIDNMLCGFTMKGLRALAFQFAQKNNILHRFDAAKLMAGKDCMYGFLKRHPDLSLRNATATGISRAIGFNKVQVKRYFNNLEHLLTKFKFHPHRIFNMDETGVSTVPTKTAKVIICKRERSVDKTVSGERGQTITVVCCMSAPGNFVPPTLIFSRKKMKPELLDGAPPSYVGIVSDSSFINSELFLDWLQYFQDNVRSFAENHCMLLLDNHASLISLPAIDFYRKYHIHMLSLPPHSSHKAQPLYRSFFGPLKAFYSCECDKWMIKHPDRPITVYQVASIFTKTNIKAATNGNAMKGVEVTAV